MIRLALYVCSVALVAGELVDLTHYNDERAQTWPHNRKFVMTSTFNGWWTAVDPTIWLRNEDFTTASHAGTHMDAPCHFAKYGWCIEEIPPERFISPLVVIDHQQRSAQNPNDGLTVADILDWESQHGRIPPGAMVLSLSGWAKKYKDDAAYSGNPNFREWPNVTLNFPSFSGEAAKFLVTERIIYGAGSDTLSLDVGNSPNFPAHVAFADASIILIENVGDGIHRVPASGATVITLPIKNKGASGAPVRMLAYWGNDELRFIHSGGSHVRVTLISFLVCLLLAMA